MADVLRGHEDEIRRRVARGETLRSISEYLQMIYPSVAGLSTRSVRRFCRARGINYRSQLTDFELDRIVQQSVFRHGHSYGRRTLHGLLRSTGVHVSQQRVGQSLRRLFPLAHSQRAVTLGRSMNPIPYQATYYGEKVHLDQNEKLVMYGVVHVVAIDGFSRKIVGCCTMPRKNAITIYNTIFRPLLLTEGIWDQVRTDHGTEFALIGTIQEYLSSHRTHQERSPILQSTSRHNHRVERIWPEVNSRINYPMKSVLIRMEHAELIDMRNDIHKFSVSWVCIKVISSPLHVFIQSWNSHRIPGRNGGIPNTLASSTREISPLHQSVVPSVDEAIHIHETIRSHLTPESTYGSDPIEAYTELKKIRERDFFAQCQSMEAVFTNVLHGNGRLLIDAIELFITLTEQFASII